MMMGKLIFLKCTTVSTVVADVLSKDDSLLPLNLKVVDLKKRMVHIQNDGENKMMAFVMKKP